MCKERGGLEHCGSCHVALREIYDPMGGNGDKWNDGDGKGDNTNKDPNAKPADDPNDPNAKPEDA